MPARIYTDSRVVADSRQYAVDRGFAVDRLAVESAVDPYADYLVYCTFTADNETAIESYVPEKDIVGSGFQTGLSGTWKITGNKAYQSTGAGGANTVYIDTGASDITVECIVNCGTAAAVGLIVRAKDGDDNIEVMLDPGGDLVRVFKNVGGARAELSTVSTPLDASTDYNVKVVLNGTSIKVYINDVLKNDFNDSTHLTETGVGFWTWNASNDARWDNLTAQL